MLKPSRCWMLGLALAMPLSGVALSSTPPKGSVAETLTQAATEVSFLSFDRALPLFENAMQLSPVGSDQWQAAAFGRATCLNQITPATPENISEAATSFADFIQKYPQSRFTPQSMMALGRIQELVDYKSDVPRRESAREWYEKARAAAGQTALAHEATLRIAGTLIQEMKPQSVRQGIEVLESWLKQYPTNPLASAMWQYAADSYFYPLEEHRRALDCYIRADGIGFLERGREGPLYWRMANLAERVNDREVAVTYYTKIIKKTPTSGKAYESQLALKRLGAPVPEISIFATAATLPADARVSAPLVEKP